MIRSKKPWAVASAALILFGFAISVAAAANVYRSVSEERFGEATEAVDKLVSKVGELDAEYTKAAQAYSKTQTSRQELIKPLTEREYWLEVYRAINECLPRAKDVEEDIQDPTKRPRINVKSITTRREPDLAAWHAALDETAKGWMTDVDRGIPPSGEGYVFTLECEHHHSGENSATEAGIGYVEHTLLKNLKEWTVQPPEGGPPVPVGKIGISHALILGDWDTHQITYDPENRGAPPPAAADAVRRNTFGGPPAAATTAPPPSSTARQIEETTCLVQFVWVKTPPDKRPAEPPKRVAPPPQTKKDAKKAGQKKK
jgi:type IV pilus assembly protein PilM